MSKSVYLMISLLLLLWTKADFRVYIKCHKNLPLSLVCNNSVFVLRDIVYYLVSKYLRLIFKGQYKIYELISTYQNDLNIIFSISNGPLYKISETVRKIYCKQRNVCYLIHLKISTS